MSKFVDGDVVALIVHAVGADTGAKASVVVSHAAFPGMTGTARGVDSDFRTDEVCFVFWEAELAEDGRHAFGCKGFLVGV